MYRVIEVDGWFRLLVVKTGTTTEAVFHTRQEADAGCAEDNRYERAERAERATMAGMAFGVQGYNDAMGYDVSTPEPCGHHCHSDCPRCGGE